MSYAVIVYCMYVSVLYPQPGGPVADCGTRPGDGVATSLRSINHYKLDLVAIQEMRWTGTGILEKRKHSVYYSCNDRLHEFGTGFVVRGDCRRLVIRFKPISPRLCLIRISGKFYNYSILSVHAPTEVANEEEKDLFYDQLERTLDACPDMI